MNNWLIIFHVRFRAWMPFLTLRFRAWMPFLTKKKRQINILGKFPSDSNARNITHNCEFSNAVLRYAIRMLPGINEKTQSYSFTSGPGSLPSVLSRSTWKLMCFFFLLPRTPVRLNHCMHSFPCSCWPRNMYRCVISTKILAWSTNSILKPSWCFEKNK